VTSPPSGCRFFKVPSQSTRYPNEQPTPSGATAVTRFWDSFTANIRMLEHTPGLLGAVCRFFPAGARRAESESVLRCRRFMWAAYVEELHLTPSYRPSIKQHPVALKSLSDWFGRRSGDRFEPRPKRIEAFPEEGQDPGAEPGRRTGKQKHFVPD